MSRKLPLLVALAGLAAGCTTKPPEPPPGENPCDPNPCNQVAHRTVCVAEGGNARCLCEPDFLSRPSGMCEAVTAANCPEHAGDSAEPDDCSARAKELSTTDSQRAQTIDPIGDQDFFKVIATQGNVYEVTVSTEGNTNLFPRVDLYDQGGSHLDWVEATGQLKFYFKAYTNASYYLRVSHSPMDWAVATGNYIVSIHDAGPDDHGDGQASATAITADPEGQTPAVRSGRFDFPEDHDWFSFPADSNSYYTLAFPSQSTVPTVRVVASNGQELLWTPGQKFRVPVNGTTYLELIRSNGGASTYGFTLVYSNIP